MNGALLQPLFYGIVSILKQWGHVMAANQIDFCSE